MAKLSVIIPRYNEIATIQRVLSAVESASPQDKELIIVDDGSTDGTRDFLKTVPHTVIYHDTNQGKGSALQTGLVHVTGDVVIIQDADLEYNPDDYSALIQPILEGYEVVYGSRFHNGYSSGYFIHYLANRFLTFLSNMATGFRLTDMETCYKVFKNGQLSAKHFNLLTTGPC